MAANDEVYEFDYETWVAEEKARSEGKKVFQSNKGLRERAGLDSEVPEAGVYYRQMSKGEYDESTKKGGQFKFDAAFTYTNTDNYRYWVSTSLGKVVVFDNENAAESESRIVKFTFRVPLQDHFKLMPHQMKGVQGMKDVVAFHREGFGSGNVKDPTDMQKLIDSGKPFNLGFTSSQKDVLNGLLEGHEIVEN